MLNLFIRSNCKICPLPTIQTCEIVLNILNLGFGIFCFSSHLCQLWLIRNIKIRYDVKTPHFAIFGTRVICVSLLKDYCKEGVNFSKLFFVTFHAHSVFFFVIKILHFSFHGNYMWFVSVFTLHYKLPFLLIQASTLTQNDTGPVGPVTPSICWSCNIFTGPTFFL